LLVSLTPFVSRLSADPKPLAQFAEIASWLTRQRQKLLSQAQGRTLLPRHVALLKRFSCHCLLCYPCLWTPVTHVSGLYIPKGKGKRKAERLFCRSDSENMNKWQLRNDKWKMIATVQSPRTLNFRSDILSSLCNHSATIPARRRQTLRSPSPHAADRVTASPPEVRRHS
jgi:hypothetical protein